MKNVKWPLTALLMTVSIVQISHAEVAIAPPTPNELKVEEKLAINEDFKLFDSNTDNAISFDEFYQGKKLKEKKQSEEEVVRILKRCDKNKDGSLSPNELPEEDKMFIEMGTQEYDSNRCMYPREAFELLDENADKIVTKAELLSSMTRESEPNDKKIADKRQKRVYKREAKRRLKTFKGCDTNLDGMLTMREGFSMKCEMTLFTEQFDAFDTDFDGVLSIEEVGAEVKPVTYRASVDPRVIEARKKMPPLMQLESSMFECDKDEDYRLAKNELVGEQCELDMDYFDKVDRNQDGFISRQEIERMQMKKTFERMDKDKNGELDQSEFKHQ